MMRGAYNVNWTLISLTDLSLHARSFSRLYKHYLPLLLHSFSHWGKVRIFVRIVRNIVLLWLGKKQGHLASRTKFCRTSRQCLLKSIKPGLSPKNLDSTTKIVSNRIPILVLYLKIQCTFCWRLCSAWSTNSNPRVIYSVCLLHQSSWVRPKRDKCRYTWWHDPWPNSSYKKDYSRQ
jgi:hypothetical protein